MTNLASIYLDDGAVEQGRGARAGGLGDTGEGAGDGPYTFASQHGAFGGYVQEAGSDNRG